MAVAFRQAAGAGTPNVTPITATFPSALLAGSLVIACMYVRDLTLPIVTDSLSNTYNIAGTWSGETVGAVNRRGYIVYAYNVNSGSCTVTGNSVGGTATLDLAIHEFTGFGTGDPLDDVHYQFDATSAFTTDTITTNKNKEELIFSFFVTRSALAAGNTSGDGFTVAVDTAAFDSNQTRYLIVSATGTYGPSTFLGSPDDESWGGIASFSPGLPLPTVRFPALPLMAPGRI